VVRGGVPYKSKKLGNVKLCTDLSSESIIDLGMPRDGSLLVVRFVPVD
jgi:hypothetical protein